MSNKIYLSKETKPRQILMVKNTPDIGCSDCVFCPYKTIDGKFHCERRPISCIRLVFGKTMFFHFIPAKE